jgi:hypothetical protein
MLAQLLRLRRNSLLTLDVENNSLGDGVADEGMKDFILAIEQTRALNLLLMRHNGFNASAQRMLKGMTKPKRLRLIIV